MGMGLLPCYKDRSVEARGSLPTAKRDSRPQKFEPTIRIGSAAMGAVTTSVIAIAGVILGWITIEIACKPCLDRGREALDRELNPDYDPDDAIRAPLVDPPAVEAFEPKSEIKDAAAPGPATIKLA
uniref:Transmembrane protein n=1 Tax=Kalanchoe fedtschenkoi TaxID=63787 RepID=A0A7N0VIQ3_KALFE